MLLVLRPLPFFLCSSTTVHSILFDLALVLLYGHCCEEGRPFFTMISNHDWAIQMEERIQEGIWQEPHDIGLD